jgi:hypothetical protein
VYTLRDAVVESVRVIAQPRFGIVFELAVRTARGTHKTLSGPIGICWHVRFDHRTGTQAVVRFLQSLIRSFGASRLDEIEGEKCQLLSVGRRLAGISVGGRMYILRPGHARPVKRCLGR